MAFKVRHTTEETEDELSCVVSLGRTIVDVFVRHRVYGKIGAELNIASPEQVRQFLKNIRTGKSTKSYMGSPLGPSAFPHTICFFDGSFSLERQKPLSEHWTPAIGRT